MSDDDLEIRPGLVLPAGELRMSAARSGGPGGQHVNVTSSKVELRFDLAASAALSEGQKARLRTKLPPRVLTQAGEVVVTCETHRDQHRNREGARQKLAALLRKALERPKPRIPTKPSRASKERRIQAKKEQGQKKQRRRAGWD